MLAQKDTQHQYGYLLHKIIDFCQLIDLMSNLFQSDYQCREKAAGSSQCNKRLNSIQCPPKAKLLSEAVCSLNLAGHEPAIKIQMSLSNRQYKGKKTS